MPLGTTNNFARALAIPLTLPGAIAVITSGKVADVDLGRAGDATFANLVSVGLYTQVAANVPHQVKRITGRAAADRASQPASAPAVPRCHHCRHPPSYTVDTHQLNIANGSFHAGRPITSDATADDRLPSRLHPRRARPPRAHHRHDPPRPTRNPPRPHRASLPRRQRPAARHRPAAAPDVDGEIRGHTPTRITLTPEALRVMVAQTFPDT